MGFYQRFSLFARSEANGVLDDVSDRQRLIRQHLRDSEDALAAEQHQLARLERDHCDYTRKTQQLSAKLKNLDQDIQLCLDQDQDDLAKFNIAKYLPLKEQHEQAQSQLDGINEELEKQRQLCSDHQNTLEELQTRCYEELAQEQNIQDHNQISPSSTKDEDISMELLRRKKASEDKGE